MYVQLAGTWDYLQACITIIIRLQTREKRQTVRRYTSTERIGIVTQVLTGEGKGGRKLSESKEQSAIAYRKVSTWTNLLEVRVDNTIDLAAM